MNFARHSNLEGQHAFLGASNYHWLNYSDEKIYEWYYKYLAKERGTRYHELAAQMISLGVRAENKKKTFNMYVNDAIGYKMTPEVVLYYSTNCFGTADAISYRKEKNRNVLRIHDLKTGESGNMNQLRIYASLFCLEYDVKPHDIDIELRLYRNNEIEIENPEADIIVPIMDKIISADKIISRIISEEN